MQLLLSGSTHFGIDNLSVLVIFMNVGASYAMLCKAPVQFTVGPVCRPSRRFSTSSATAFVGGLSTSIPYRRHLATRRSRTELLIT